MINIFMEYKINFKEYLRLSEAGIIQPNADPNVLMTNKAILGTAQSMSTTPQGKSMNADDLLNQAAKNTVLTGKVTPGNAIKALNPGNPNQTQQRMMKKRMNKK